MKSKLVAQYGGERTFVLILDPGDEAFSAISRFAAEERLSAASLAALGAFSKATVGWFDLDAKSYRKIPVDQQCEGDVGQCHRLLRSSVQETQIPPSEVRLMIVLPSKAVVDRVVELRRTIHRRPELGFEEHET